MVISGAKNEGALCYLLEIDNEVEILPDCGWNDEFNLDDLKHLRCAYPYAFDYFGLNYTVYATVPVIRMGRMCMYDIYQSKVNEIEFNTLALDNVDLAFERINVLKYSQPMILGDGAVLHSNGVVLDALSQPSLMITDAYNSLVIHPPRKLHDTALFGIVKSATSLDLTINLMINKKVPLEGVELLEYKAMQCKKQEREAAQPALVAKSLSIIEEDEADDEKSEAGDADMEELLAKQFDLYVRDVTKYGGFFKQLQSYLMYPYIEKRKRYDDDYGEIIPPDMFKRIDGSIGNDGIGVEPIGDREDMGGGDREELDKDSNHSSLDSNVPTKYVSYNEDVTFKCQIQFIYLEGTNDRRSLKTIVLQVQPRKLVIKYCFLFINSCGYEATKDFAQSCLALESMTKNIYTPDVGETLNVSAAINFYQVKLTDAFVSSLNFLKLEDYDIAFIMGKFSFPQDYSLPILDAIPIEENTSNNNPIFVGEVKLSKLKHLLQSEGIKAEFKGEGVLFCNEKVTIKK
ncbi:15276_t:CDS:2, partial [Entrophospora sp. SA101]